MGILFAKVQWEPVLYRFEPNLKKIMLFILTMATSFSPLQHYHENVSTSLKVEEWKLLRNLRHVNNRTRATTSLGIKLISLHFYSVSVGDLLTFFLLFFLPKNLSTISFLFVVYFHALTVLCVTKTKNKNNKILPEKCRCCVWPPLFHDFVVLRC